MRSQRRTARNASSAARTSSRRPGDARDPVLLADDEQHEPGADERERAQERLDERDAVRARVEAHLLTGLDRRHAALFGGRQGILR